LLWRLFRRLRGGETLKETNRRSGSEITAEMVAGFWDGERMDLHTAVHALLACNDGPLDEERCGPSQRLGEPLVSRKCKMKA
jgi:hypothetical protein